MTPFLISSRSHPPVPSFPSVNLISLRTQKLRFLIMLANLEVARFWGDGVKYKSCWDRCSLMHKNAKLLRDAVEAGLDPFKVELIDAPSKVQGNKGKMFIVLVICTEHRFFPFCEILLASVDICQKLLLGSAVTALHLLSRIDSALSREMPS